MPAPAGTVYDTSSDGLFRAGCGLSWCGKRLRKKRNPDCYESISIEEEDLHECMV